MEPLNIAMVGTRFAGLDGVTLESIKVAHVLEKLGHHVFWFAGRLGEEFTPGREVATASFDTPDNLALSSKVFGSERCEPRYLDEIVNRADELQHDLESFVGVSDIDVLMPQNALAIPMQVPLGLAIDELPRYVRKMLGPPPKMDCKSAW